jgi:menaquinone-dependent protoporphyrinogen oxidase
VVIMTVLVTYATSEGSTRGVAERIADRLTSRGLSVSCLGVHEVRDLVSSFDAVVIGSAIHGQAWLPSADRFVCKHEADIASRPTWLFSVGMPAALARSLRTWAMVEGDKVVEPYAAVHARSTRLFSGVVDKSQLPLFGRIVFRLLGGHYGDFRDWAAIDAWADEIADALVPTPV